MVAPRPLHGLARLLPALVLTLAIAPALAPAQEPKPATGVAAIRETHDRALIADLQAYLKDHPEADDREQGFLTLFETAISHDWYGDVEPTALDYLKANPEGEVRSTARIITTMARARAGKLAEALREFQALMEGLEGDDQIEFATSFTDTVAAEATTAGQYDIARQVYQALQKRYGQDEGVAAKLTGDLARLDLVGQPAPDFSVNDLDRKPVKLTDFQGKPVLIDFWASWSGPNLDALPALRKAHERGLAIVSVSLDEEPGAVILAAKEQELNWLQVHNATCGTDLAAAFLVSNIPASVLIGPDGKVQRLDLRGPALERALDALVGPAPKTP